jgi:Ser/Thr protein kinase RdoA (MazF antagonist)
MAKVLKFPDIQYDPTNPERTPLLYDPQYWLPFVHEICSRHSIPAKEISGVPQGFEGSTPVLIIDKTYVIKLLIPLPWSDGFTVYESELNSSEVLSKVPQSCKVPRVLYHGSLIDNRPAVDQYMMYVVTGYLHGVSFAEVFPSFSRQEQMKFAYDFGVVIGKIHHIPPSSFELQSWQTFIKNIYNTVEDRLRKKGVPQHLLQQLPHYLPSDISNFYASGDVVFMHCDFHRDHVFLEKSEMGWEISALLDWGDCRFGDPFYELATIHCDLFRCDLGLLKQFLAGYATESNFFQRPDFVYRSMVNLLLFEWNHWVHKTKPKGIFYFHPEYRELSTFEELANAMWDTDRPWTKETH